MQLEPENNADTLIYYIHKFFLSNNISLNKIEIVSLSNGPGSFTGLRISSAIAKGICYSNHSKLIELSTLDIIANKKSSLNKTIPLISSNTKTNEYYYSEYINVENKIERISEYKIDTIENILNVDALFLINEKFHAGFPDILKSRVADVSGLSNIDVMDKLTRLSIDRNKFGDYRISEPFYMKDFVPNI